MTRALLPVSLLVLTFAAQAAAEPPPAARMKVPTQAPVAVRRPRPRVVAPRVRPAPVTPAPAGAPATGSSRPAAGVSAPTVRAIGNGRHFTVVMPQRPGAMSVYAIARQRGLPTTHDNLRTIIEDVSFDQAVDKANTWSKMQGHELKGRFRAYSFIDDSGTKMSITARQSHADPTTKPSPDGWTDLPIHANENGALQEQKADGTRVNWTPASLAKELRARGYDGGPVRLLGCRAGRSIRYGVNTAQQLANELHAPVVAASEYSWTYPDGHVVTQNGTFHADTKTWSMDGNKGRWRVYVPDPAVEPPKGSTGAAPKTGPTSLLDAPVRLFLFDWQTGQALASA